MYIVVRCFHSFCGCRYVGFVVIRFEATHALGGAGWAVIQFRFGTLLFRASFMFLRRGTNVRTDRPVSVEGKDK